MSKFCSLAELAAWTPSDTPSDTPAPRCAYIVSTGYPCKSRMNHKASNEAKSVVLENLGIFTASSGGYTDASRLFKFLQSLANLHLCHIHRKHNSQATAQWLEDFREDRVFITAKLEECYNLGIDYTRAGESGDEKDEFDSSEIRTSSDENGSDDEKSLFIQKQDVSSLSGHSSSPIRVARCTLTYSESEVAKAVTSLLEKPIENKSKEHAHIYVICSHDLPGMFKVGISIKQPEIGRFRQHKKCYPKFEVVMTKLIPYAYRVERLVLTELFNKRYAFDCQNCKSNHTELLDIDKDSLLKCLEKWSSFVESRPYNTQGRLTQDAKDNLPPVLRSYLGCKTFRLSFPRSPTPKRKGASKDSDISPLPTLNLMKSTPLTKHSRVQEVELDQDDLCAGVRDLQLTPSRRR